MKQVTDPDIIARVKALSEAQKPEQIATPDTAPGVRVTDPATIARVRLLAAEPQRMMAPKSAVDTFLAQYRAGTLLTPGALELIEDQEPGWADRYLVGGAKQFAHGLSSLVPSVATVAGGLASKAGLGEGLADWGNNAQKYLDEKLAVENPNLYHHIMSGLGSMSSFLLPGLGVSGVVGKGIQGASWAAKSWSVAGRAIKAGEVVQSVLGSTAMSALESGVEMADLMQQKMDEGMSADQAMSEAQRVFNLNMPVLMATNMGYFHPASRWARAALEAFSEGGQERYQGVVQDVVSGRGKWSDFLDPSKYQTETLVGAIIGGAGGAASPGVSKKEDGGEATGDPADPTFNQPLPENYDAYDDGTAQEAPGAPQAAAPAGAAQGAAQPEIDAEARARARQRPSVPLGEPVDEYTAVLNEMAAERELLNQAVSPQPIETPEQAAARQNAANRQASADELPNRRRETAARRVAVRRELRAARMNMVHAAADARARRIDQAKFSREQILHELEAGLNAMYGVDFKLSDRLNDQQLAELEEMVRSTYAHPDALVRDDLAEATVRRAREMLFKGSPAGTVTDARAMFDDTFAAPDAAPQAAPVAEQGSSTFAAGPLDMQAALVQEALAGDRLGPPPGGREEAGLGRRVTDPAEIARVRELAGMPAETKEQVDERDDGNAAAGPEAVDTGVRERGDDVDGAARVAQEPVQDGADQGVAVREQPGTESERGAKAESGRTVVLPIEQIETDPDRLQVRTEVGEQGVDESFVNQAAENFDERRMDPITVWRDPRSGKILVLDGHHRLAILKKIQSKTAEVRFFDGTEAEAISYAQEANDARRQNDATARAATVRGWRNSGMTKGEVTAKAKQLYGKDASFVLALSHINPKGRLMDAVRSLASNPDAAADITKMANWIGKAREAFPSLTNAHETEMFKFLEKNMGSGGLTSATAFQSLVEQRGMMGDFSGMESLNLNKIKPSSAESKSFDALLSEAKAEKSRLIKERDAEAGKYEDRAKTATDQGEKSNLLAAAGRVRDRYNEMIRAQDIEIGRIMTEWRAVQDRGNTQGTMFFAARGLTARLAADMGLDPRALKVVPEPKSGGFDVVRRTANMFGLEVNFLEYSPGGAPVQLPFHGAYNAETRSLVIDINSDAPLGYVILHEIGHDIAASDRNLKEQIYRMMVDGRPGSMSKLTVALGFEERFADAFANAVLEPGFWKKAKQINPGAVALIRQKLDDMMAAIQAFIRKYNLDPRPYFKTAEAINERLQAAGLERIRQVQAGKAAPESSAQGILFFRLDKTQKELNEIDRSDDTAEMKEMRRRTAMADARLRAEGKFTAERGRRNFYRHLVDRNHPIYTHFRDAMKLAGQKIDDLTYEKRPDKIMQLFRGWTIKAEVMIRDQVVDKDGNKLSDSLENIIADEKVAKDIDDGTFSEFLKSMRVMATYKSKGDAYFADPNKHPEMYAAQKEELEKHRAIVEKYGTRENWERAAKKMTTYSNAVMHRAVEGGVLSQEGYDAMVSAYDVFAHLFVMEMADQHGQAGKPKAGAGPVTYTQGQLLPDVARQDPIDAYIKMTYRINHLAEQNISKVAMIEVIEDLCSALNVKVGDGIDGLGRRVAPKRMARWESALDMLRAMGFNFRGHPEWKETRKRHFAEAKAEILGESGVEWGDMSKEEKAEITKLANAEANSRAVEEISELVVADMARNGIDLGRADSARAMLDSMHELWVAAQLQDDGVITVMRDGKREYWQVDPELFDLFVSQGNSAISQVIRKLYGTQSKLLRAGAVTTLEFSSKNFMRDMLMAAIQSRHLIDIKELPVYPVVLGYRLMKGVGHVIRRDATWQEMMMAGSGMAEMPSVDRMGLRQETRDLIRRTSKGKVALHFATHPIEFMQTLSMITEQSTRVAVYERTAAKKMKAGATRAEAMAYAGIQSREASLDFGRSGDWGQVLNTIIPFFNAGVQGTDKLFRVLVKEGSSKEKAAAWTKLLYMVTAPSILLWMMNHDDEWYQERPMWEKNLFWIYSPDGGKTRLYYPKPFEAGLLFGTLPERMLDWHYHKDKKGVDLALREIVMTMVPTHYSDLGGPIARSLFEAKSNFDNFRGSKIVRGRAEQAEARDQYTRSTTSLAKLAGDKFPFKSGGLSPAKIEHVVRGSTGGLGVNVMRGLSWAYDQTLNREEAAKRPAAQEVFGIPTDLPFVGRLVRTFAQQEPTAYTRHVDDYYEMYDHAMTVANSFNIHKGTADRPRLASLMRREGVWVSAAAAVRSQNKIVNSINTSIRAIENAPADKYTPEQKREEINALLIQRSEVCMDAYQTMMSVVNNPKFQEQAEKMADKIERGR